MVCTYIPVNQLLATVVFFGWLGQIVEGSLALCRGTFICYGPLGATAASSYTPASTKQADTELMSFKKSEFSFALHNMADKKIEKPLDTTFEDLTQNISFCHT